MSQPAQKEPISTSASPRHACNNPVSIPASELQVGQSLLMNGKWREILDIETPEDRLDNLKVVLEPNLPGTRFIKLNPTSPVQMKTVRI